MVIVICVQLTLSHLHLIIFVSRDLKLICYFSREIGLTVVFVMHYTDIIMSAMASKKTGVSIVCSTVYSGADERKHQSSSSLAFLKRIHQWLVHSPHKGTVTQKMFPFDDVIMTLQDLIHLWKWRGSWINNNLQQNPKSHPDMMVSVKAAWISPSVMVPLIEVPNAVMPCLRVPLYDAWLGQQPVP